MAAGSSTSSAPPQGDGGGGHAGESGTVRGLGHGEPSGRPDGHEAAGTVGPRAGEHHRHATLTPMLGDRIEQAVDAGARPEAWLGVAHHQTLPVDADVVVRRSDANGPWQQGGTVDRLPDLQVGAAGHQLYQ